MAFIPIAQQRHDHFWPPAHARRFRRARPARREFAVFLVLKAFQRPPALPAEK
jgi:hypothetical protein